MSQETLGGLEESFDRFIGIAMARQCAFADTVPTPFWEWKYEDNGEQGVIEIPNLGTFETQFLGTEDYVANTWLCAWADQSISPGFAHASAWLADNAEKLGDKRLGAESLRLDQINGDYVGVIATTILEASSYIALPINNGQGMSFQVVFDIPLINFAPTPLNRIHTVLQMIEQSTQVSSVSAAAHHYLLDEGFQCVEGENDEGFQKVFTDEFGREVIFMYKEVKEDGETFYEVTRSLQLSEEQQPISPDHFDVRAQWDAFVRAPLSRKIS